MSKSEPKPTKRFVIEPSLECNILCKFCYHKHKHFYWRNTRKTLDQVKAEIDAGIARGNNYMDITGGEPTMYPHIVEVVKYALKRDVKSCIITNGIVSKKKAGQLIDAGLDDWLISRHGLEQVHNKITDFPKAWDKQQEFITFINRHMDFRFNCVLTKYNQYTLNDVCSRMAISHPRIINIINFNPHAEWENHGSQAEDFIVNFKELDIEEPVRMLERWGIKVNLRYFPMCHVPTDLRRCVCNDLQVVFDPYEWDYQIQPKTFEAFRKWGVETSMAVEEKCEPCNQCGLQWICGGINRNFHKISNKLYGEICRPERFPGIIDDFYHYRKDQKL